MDNIENEVQAVKAATEQGRLLTEIIQQHERENKRLWAAVIALVVALSVMCGCALWAVVNAQRVVDEAMWKALNAVGDVTTTTTETTVNQDTGEGNGNAIYQAGEHARYTEGGAN